MRGKGKNIIIFASGNGTNAENIIRYFQKSSTIRIVEILTNNSEAGVVAKANKFDIPVRIVLREDFSQPTEFIQYLLKKKIDLIVLAGFLWKIPSELILQFPEKIINLHPALLPAFGGKGMYGMHVHEAVIASRQKKSGITIHFVNEKYDEGKIIFQAETPVQETDTPESLAEKIHQLEYANFPKVIETVLSKK